MPIYAYRCAACGHEKDVLQRLSDPALEICPACGAAAFARQVSAPAFQLKGSGWYVTDFRDGGKKPAARGADGGESAEGAPAAGGTADPAKPDAKSDAKSEAKSDAKPEAKSDAKPADASKPVAAAKPAGGAKSSSTGPAGA